MSIQQRILTAMRANCIYRPCDLAAELNMDTGEVGKILKMFERGGLVEVVKGDEYRRKRMYQTRQKDLF